MSLYQSRKKFNLHERYFNNVVLFQIDPDPSPLEQAMKFCQQHLALKSAQVISANYYVFIHPDTLLSLTLKTACSF